MKFIYVSLFLLVSSTVANSQAALLALIFGDKVASENFHLSIDLGVNRASLPGIADQKAISGFYYGLGTYVKINDKWALTPEFKPVSPRGAKNVPPIKDYAAVLNDLNYKLALNYIDVPVLVQYRAGKKWMFSAGPQISFLTAANQLADGKLKADNSVVSIKESVWSSFNKTYFTAPLEVGYRLNDARGGKGVNIKMRYNIGLSNMIANEKYGSSNGSTFQFFLSFPFIKVQTEK